MIKKYILINTLAIFSFFNVFSQQILNKEYNHQLIHEDFNNESIIFPIINNTENYFVLDNGDYLLIRNNNMSGYQIIANNSSSSNFILKTSIRIGPSRNKEASLGIILKEKENKRESIIFEINSKGNYRIKKIKGNRDQILTNKKNNGWVKNKIINKSDLSNEIEIRTENNTFDIYVNNSYLTSFFAGDYTTGSSGFIISSATKARVGYYYINEKDTRPNQESEKNKIEILNNEIRKLKMLTIEQDNKSQNITNKNNEIKNNSIITPIEEKQTEYSTKESETLKIIKHSINDKETEIKTIGYAVQIGVYMNQQANLTEAERLWYQKTEAGSFIYLSGRFRSLKEATEHKNNLLKSGYYNAFVVGLIK